MGTTEVSTRETNLQAVPQTHSHEALEDEKFKVAKGCNSLEQGMQKDKAAIASLENEIAALTQKVEGMNKQASEDPPIISMFAYVSKVEWDTTFPALIKGNAVWKSKNEIKPFQLEADANPFFVADYLWDML